MKLWVCCFDLKIIAANTEHNLIEQKLRCRFSSIKSNCICSTYQKHEQISEKFVLFFLFFFISLEMIKFFGCEQQKVFKIVPFVLYCSKWKRLLNTIGLNTRMNDSWFYYYSSGLWITQSACSNRKCHRNGKNEFHFELLLCIILAVNIFIIITSLSLSIKFHIHILWWKSYF